MLRAYDVCGGCLTSLFADAGLDVFSKAPVNFTNVGKFRRSFSLKGFGNVSDF